MNSVVQELPGRSCGFRQGAISFTNISGVKLTGFGWLKMVGWDLTMAAFFCFSFFLGHFFFRGKHILVWEGRKLLEASGSLSGNYLSLPPDTPHSANLGGSLKFHSRNLGKMMPIFDSVLLKNVTQHAPKRKAIFPKLAQCSNIQVGEETSFIHLQNICQKYLGR